MSEQVVKLKMQDTGTFYKCEDCGCNKFILVEEGIYKCTKCEAEFKVDIE